VTLKEQLESFRSRMEAFSQWESEQPPVERSPAAILADLGFLMTWASAEDRLRDPDPVKLGIQRMRALLALVDGK
jgi:hypothetical protein